MQLTILIPIYINIKLVIYSCTKKLRKKVTVGNFEVEISVHGVNSRRESEAQASRHPQEPEGTWMAWTLQRIVNGQAHIGKWVSTCYKQDIPMYCQPCE